MSEEKLTILSPDETTAIKKDLFEKFKRADIDGDKQLNYNEFKSLFYKIMPNAKDDDIKNLFDILDANHDGNITYNEFLDSNQFQQFLNKLGFKTARGIDDTKDQFGFDIDNDADVDKKTYTPLTIKQANEFKKKLKDLFRKADINQDDELDFGEFYSIFGDLFENQTRNEVRKVFNKLDEIDGDKNGKITYKQILKTENYDELLHEFGYITMNINVQQSTLKLSDNIETELETQYNKLSHQNISNLKDQALIQEYMNLYNKTMALWKTKGRQAVERLAELEEEYIEVKNELNRYKLQYTAVNDDDQTTHLELRTTKSQNEELRTYIKQLTNDKTELENELTLLSQYKPQSPNSIFEQKYNELLVKYKQMETDKLSSDAKNMKRVNGLLSTIKNLEQKASESESNTKEKDKQIKYLQLKVQMLTNETQTLKARILDLETNADQYKSELNDVDLFNEDLRKQKSAKPLKIQMSSMGMPDANLAIYSWKRMTTKDKSNSLGYDQNYARISELTPTQVCVII